MTVSLQRFARLSGATLVAICGAFLIASDVRADPLVSTFAGSGAFGTGDGQGAASTFMMPTGIARDAPAYGTLRFKTSSGIFGHEPLFDYLFHASQRSHSTAHHCPGALDLFVVITAHFWFPRDSYSTIARGRRFEPVDLQGNPM